MRPQVGLGHEAVPALVRVDDDLAAGRLCDPAERAAEQVREGPGFRHREGPRDPDIHSLRLLVRPDRPWCCERKIMAKRLRRASSKTGKRLYRNRLVSVYGLSGRFLLGRSGRISDRVSV